MRNENNEFNGLHELFRVARGVLGGDYASSVGTPLWRPDYALIASLFTPSSGSGRATARPYSFGARGRARRAPAE